MPHRMLRRIQPVINHVLAELRAGAPCEHVIRQAALKAALVGAGLPFAQANRLVEEHEAELIGLWPGEAYEGYHPGYAAGVGYGKPSGYAPMGMMPYGKMMPPYSGY